MTKSKISLEKALELLEQEELSKEHEVEFADSDRVEATIAIKLGALGIDIPDEMIYYDDEAIQDDEDFAGDWVRIDSDIEDYKKHLTIQLKIDKEIENWLSSTEVDLDELVSELITGFYRSSQMLKNK